MTHVRPHVGLGHRETVLWLVALLLCAVTLTVLLGTQGATSAATDGAATVDSVTARLVVPEQAP